MNAGEPSSPHARLARAALEEYVRRGRVLPAPDDVPEDLLRRAACFVSLKKDGALRGCIGTIEPVEETLAAEIIANAISAGTRDPRFLPVTPEELPWLQYSVDVLTPPEPIPDLTGHDPRRYGLIVEGFGRRGLLLPDLEGVDTPEQQLAICLSKAGLSSPRGIRLYRFTVERYR
ncbi:MAG: AmmeMemoRadiSam system protein A [Armatimonadota bacterium]